MLNTELIYPPTALAGAGAGPGVPREGTTLLIEAFNGGAGLVRYYHSNYLST